MCPITSKEKGYPFEVRLPPSCPIQGVVLADHVKNMDWRARQTSSAGRVPEAAIDEVLGKLNGLFPEPGAPVKIIIGPRALRCEGGGGSGAAPTGRGAPPGADAREWS